MGKLKLAMVWTPFLLIILQIVVVSHGATRKPKNGQREELPTSTTNSSQVKPKTVINKLSSGLFAQEIKNGPRLYESYAALTFDFELPKEPNNFTMVFDYDCPNSNFSPAAFTCPAYYYLHKIRDKFRPTIELEHLRHPETSSSRAFNIPSCDQLSKHFHSTTITNAKLQEYQRLLRSCVDGLLIKVALDTKYGEQLLKEKVNDYGLMIHGFVENFFQFLPRASRVDKAVLLNNLLTSNALGLTHYLQEAQMWTDTVNDCKLSNIPSQLIPPEVLKLNLLKLHQLVKEKDQDFVIPLVNGGLSEYYKAPLTDCVMTKDRFHVRVLIPIKEKTSNWKTYSLSSIPFIYNDGVDGTLLVCGVKEDDSSIYAFDVNSNRSFPLHFASSSSSSGSGSGFESKSSSNCDVNNDALCQTGTSGQSSFRQAKKSCASVTLPFASASAAQSQSQNASTNNSNKNNHKPNTDVMSKYCDLHCEPINEFQTPIILKVASDRFFIAGQDQEAITIECSGVVEIVYPPDEGALELVLPCQCKLKYRNQRFISQEPCEKTFAGDFNMAVVKPIHLAKVTVVGFDSEHPSHDQSADTSSEIKLHSFL